MKISVHIPLEVQSQNVTDRIHWRVRHRTKEMWTNQIRYMLGKQQGFAGPLTKPERKMAVTITAYRSRRITDHANLVGGCKMVVDAIRDAGLIKDDSDKWACIAYVQELASVSPHPYLKRPSTIICVEEFPTIKRGES